MKKHIKSRPLSLVFIIIIGCSCYFSANAQKNVDSENYKLPLPVEEEFQTAADLVSPWRSSGCNALADKEFREPNCYNVNVDDWRKSDVLTLYNADGTVWYRFSLTYESSNHFLKDTKLDFLPFSTPDKSSGNIVLLRMVSESLNWYEVEVNEKTQATKFVWKNDPTWGTTKWDYWLYRSVILRVDGTQQLRDKPEGKVIEESSDMMFEKVKVMKIEGDWAYVHEFAKPKGYRGWIRWRKGREVLVGCLYNDNKVPKFEQ